MILNNALIPVSTPEGFSWKSHPLVNNIYTNGKGAFSISNFNLEEYRISGKTYYVDGFNGSDAHDGLTKETAFLNIYKAVEMSDARVIKVRGGLYHRSRTFRQQPLTRNISIESWDETPVEISTHDNLTWTKVSGYTNVYTSTRSFGYLAVDTLYKDEQGNYQSYQSVDSIEEVEATPGSLYSDLSQVYVHSLDSRPVDSSILILLILYNVQVQGAASVYFNNVHLLGGRSPLEIRKTTEAVPSFYGKKTKFLYSERGAGGLTTVSAGQVFLENCQAAYNINDGFNYHTNVVETKVIEINCMGYSNGTRNENIQDNGSTAHDGIKIIRIEGMHFSNGGPNVHDINESTQSWNMGVISGLSKAGIRLRNADYYVENQAEAWFDSCVSYGSNISLRLVNGEETKAFLRNTDLWNREDITNGSLEQY